jgi:hypothetical protein
LFLHFISKASHYAGGIAIFDGTHFKFEKLLESSH